MESDYDLSLNKLRSVSDNSSPKPFRLVVCLGRSCRKYSSEEVFAEFKANLPPNVELTSVMCLGQCGSGSMVLVEPDQVWYYQVDPDELNQVIQQHLINKIPVQEMLYPKFHQ